MIFLRHAHDLKIIPRISAAVTRGDTPNIDQLQAYGVRYIETDNEPLGAKHNAALSFAGPSERYMILPSDDLISPEWLKVFDTTTSDYIAPDRCGVYDTVNKVCKVLHNRPNGRRNFGAGRIFSRDVVDALGGKVWTDEKPAGLDTDSHARISAAGYAMDVHTCERVPLTDLKSTVNLWAYGVFKGEPSTPEEVLHMAPWIL